MHKVHVLIPWSRFDEWIEWMDKFCPGWSFVGIDQAEKRWGCGLTWMDHLADIRDKVAEKHEDCSANYQITIDTDQQLMLLRLTWTIPHMGSCLEAQCCMAYKEE